MNKAPSIECKPNGPYLVKDLNDLKSSNGAAIPTKPVIALCRCGGSANKPFCDGTHQKNGFSGARLADASAAPRDDYPAPGITIHDDRSLCAHAGRCTDGLASVFKYGSEPWIDPNGATVEAIVQAIRMCPSGALSYSIRGVAGVDEPREPAIAITKDGPYAIIGGIAFQDQPTGQSASGARYTLCRCGGSKNKPFCDGTHWSNGFKDDKN
ncbi:MAG: CDGSH iron-sulfur domain-containing protein [Burkholderiales bacterium]